MNSFLTWLKENEHIAEPLKVKQLPLPKQVIKVFTEKHVQALICSSQRERLSGDYIPWSAFLLIPARGLTKF
jgi:hypothetical protein